MKTNEIKDISADKFTFVKQNEKIYDEKFETKPIGYFQDAWIRFRKSIGSVIAAIVLCIIILFAIFGPLFTNFDMYFADMFLSNALPKNQFMADNFGIWDGTKKITMNEKQYKYYTEVIPETEYIVKVLNTYSKIDQKGKVLNYYEVVVDTYKTTGFIYELVTPAELDALKQYEQESGVQVMYPLLTTANANGEVGGISYKYDENNQLVYSEDTSGDTGEQFQIRVVYYKYFVYENGFEPVFLFGSNSHGKDLFVNLAIGARLSLVLGLSVAIINVSIGLIYGAIEGYYGSTIDLLLERLVEILGGIPFIVVVTLFSIHLADKVGVFVTLLFAYVLTGWIGTAGTVRQQFYRYKNREYVLAAKTLGAKDARLIFRHILPNAIGPVITSTVLVIPAVIFGESFLSFLGIIDLSTSGFTSIGSMLADGQDSMRTNPNTIMFPSLFISILMISFNVFGNGLRDAFNPSLRGVEE